LNTHCESVAQRHRKKAVALKLIWCHETHNSCKFVTD